ncbi:hypothetical protein [Priestia sp. GS2]|uniref:hypothetical protein n=1 Tax=Priestia sp. GS2 TaxID=3117403 RepID=UPI002EDB0BDA
MQKWTAYNQYKKSKTTPKALLLDYPNYRKLVKESEVDPIIKRMKKAKSDYFNALLDMVEVKHEYSIIFRDIHELAMRTTIDREYQHVAPPVDFENHTEIPLVTELDVKRFNRLMHADYLPEGVKRIKCK